MKLQSMLPFRTAFCRLALLAIAQAAGSDGLNAEYCSSENTGSDYSAVQDVYQSNGACFDQCQAHYAFAVVQYKLCWCSDYIPADQQILSACTQPCPGYPYDYCGNSDSGLYGYIPLSKAPSGTAGAASSTQADSSTPALSSQQAPVSISSLGPSGPSNSLPSAIATTSLTSSPTSSSNEPTTSTTPTRTSTPSRRPLVVTFSFSQSSTAQSSSQQASSQQPETRYVSQTEYRTVTQSQSASVVVSYVTPTPSTSSTYSAPPSSTSTTTTAVIAPVPAITEVPSNSLTPLPVTSTRVVTVSGAVVTQTVTSTPLVLPNSSPSTAQLQGKGRSTGAIAGIVIGTLLGLAVLLLTAFLLWRRRKQNNDTEGAAGDKRPKRNISVMSRTGLLARSKSARVNEMGERDFDGPLYVNSGTANSSVRHSMLFGAGGIGAEGAVSPVSPLEGGSSHEPAGSRRHSRPLVYDQRLNPSALFANHEANGSRVSMQDQQDYTRPLAVANPDFRPSFESRVSR